MDDQSPLRSPVKSATDARQGATTGRVRWVLVISTVGAFVALAVVYWLMR